jgi:hypothetical protein
MLILVSIAALALQTPARAADWDHFPVFVWTTSAEPLDVVEPFGGACVQRLERTEWLDAKKLDWFVFNAPGRNDLHLDRDDAYQRRWREWCEKRDDALLVRQPCLTDPATRERMSKLLSECLKLRGGRTGLGVSLGDEVSVTPNGAPEDLCLSPTCRAAWRAWLANQPGLDDARRAELGDPAKFSTDATLRALGDGDTTAIGPWLLRRHFESQVILDRVTELAVQVRRESPETPVGLLGLVGQTAFGGVAVERALPLLDFIECYDVGDARELAFTLRKPEQRVVLTVFDDPRGPDFAAWHCWEHWMRGGDGLVIWSEAELRKSPAFRDRLARAVRDIRAVQEKVGRFRPVPQGVAIVHSADSNAVSWLRDAQGDGATWPKRFPSYQEEHGELERSRKRWFEMLEDLGAMPGALPIECVDAKTFARFPMLVLESMRVLDAADFDRLNRFRQAGGHICVRGPFAMHDSQGRPLPDDEAGHVMVKTPERPPAFVEAYAGDPTSIDDLELQRWRRRASVELAPFHARATTERWNFIETWMEDGLAYLCVALPKPRAASESDAASSLPDRIAIEAGAKWRIEWIHPLPDEHGDVKLPRGDAAVFRLVPRE